MMKHRQVRKLLYEYLRGELDASQQSMVTRHLASCITCSQELDALKSAMDVVDAHSISPDSERPQEFWNSFAFQVEERIRQSSPLRRGTNSLEAFIDTVFVMHRRSVMLLGSGVVAVIILIAGLFLFHQSPQPQQQQLARESVAQNKPSIEPASERLHQYFRKSKVLLVGIANMHVDEEEPMDLSAERRVSRNLIQEARYLQQQPLDRRSEKLIGDLEKILIELANMKERDEAPNVEIIRGGIHQENLLFKIRMAESMYDSSQILQAMNKE
jgi:anti-sigma factor RsiW